MFVIVPAQAYTKADLNWRDKNSRTTIEMNNPASRPEVASHVENIARYDTVFLGFLIWWYVAPTLINTFLEQYELEGKTIVPFATSGGSGMGQTVTMLKVSAPKATIEAGAVMNMAMDVKIKKFVEPYL